MFLSWLRGLSPPCVSPCGTWVSEETSLSQLSPLCPWLPHSSVPPSRHSSHDCHHLHLAPLVLGHSPLPPCRARLIAELRGTRWVGNRLRMRTKDGSLVRASWCCGCIWGLTQGSRQETTPEISPEVQARLGQGSQAPHHTPAHWEKATWSLVLREGRGRPMRDRKDPLVTATQRK